ncbi:hypothetical protein HBN50_14260 [Halobacteriovorax sp. GB3]|uniref:hypothetical protein n=1 Tax=Halobacteriovorax sp. GB3 TaxID=2719615 RepID=UPI00235E435B|nr:hypothetical protein [Halobacteriovorax sp. GB3]MDD0854272.1 hypothetical protein [Halobacteriovorax sp. GB3]
MAQVEQKRTPHRYANSLPIEVEALILSLKREYPNWSAPKIREKIIKKFPDVKVPATSTIHAVLDRNGLVKHRKGRKRYKSQGTNEVFAFETFTRAFEEFGLPDAIRTDNGVPFASGASFYNLTKLSVWWMRLGIKIERIEPGNPQQLARHKNISTTIRFYTMNLKALDNPASRSIEKLIEKQD